MHSLDLWLQTNYVCSTHASHLLCIAYEMVVILRRHFKEDIKKKSLKSKMVVDSASFFSE